MPGLRPAPGRTLPDRQVRLMARKMFFSSAAFTDDRLMDAADLIGDKALIWPWLIPYLDDWGRGSGNPRVVKATCFPSLPVSTESIADALGAFVKVGLLQAYDDARGRPVIAVDEDAWWSYQTHVHKDKRDRDGSRFPAPPSGTPRDSAGLRGDSEESRFTTPRHATPHHDVVPASNVDNPVHRLAAAWLQAPPKNARDIDAATQALRAHPWIADLDDPTMASFVETARKQGTKFLSGLVTHAPLEFKPAKQMPDWCGECEEHSRLVETPGLGWAKCESCHPAVTR